MSLGRVAIFGPGLIGGSLALALKARGGASDIRLWARRKETLDELKKLGFTEISQSMEEIAADSDMAIICTPVASIRQIGKQIQKTLPSTAFVTDAGSTKRTIVTEMSALFGNRFLGSHPMAGSEQSGLSAARNDLFLKAGCFITPTAESLPEAVRAVRELWQSVGCHVTELDAALHDCLMARISHVPHVTASALVNLVCAKDTSSQMYAGGGYRDTTRVASGSPELWKEILMDNAREVSTALGTLISGLGEIKDVLDRQDAHRLHTILAKAKTARDLYAGNQDSYDV